MVRKENCHEKFLNMKNSRDIIKSEFKYYLANVARSSRRTSEGFNLGRTAVDSFLSFIEPNKLFDYNPEKWSHIASLYDITDPVEIKENLLKQLTSPVRWTQSVRNMIADGMTEFVECGPGQVLTGLIGRIQKSL